MWERNSGNEGQNKGTVPDLKTVGLKVSLSNMIPDEKTVGSKVSLVFTVGTRPSATCIALLPSPKCHAPVESIKRKCKYC